MLALDHQFIHFLEKHPTISRELFSGHFGLEKENLRVTPDGKLALTPHPAAFGAKEDNPYIKTDFSESQVEMITPVCNSIDEVFDFVKNLQDIVSLELSDGELLWPNSNPALLPKEEEIPIAVYRTPDHPNRLYREHLAREYGKKIQLLSGIHYNFSFSEKLLTGLYEEYHMEQETMADFRNRMYVKTAKYFMKNRWLLVYLTGAGSIYPTGYTTTPAEKTLADGVTWMENGTSLRNSSYGYKNKTPLHIDYNSFDSYIQTIGEHITEGKINSMREFYNPIRLKNSHTDQSLDSLAKNGVEYLEIRSLDLNPLEPNGISKETLRFVHLLLITGLLSADTELCHNSQTISDRNEEQIALYGLSQPSIIECDGSEKSFVEAAFAELDKMQQLVETFAHDRELLLKTIHEQRTRILDPQKTIAWQMLERVKQMGYLNYHLEAARLALADSDATAYQFAGYEDMELSTQIVMQSAVKRGVQFEILDRSENFLRLKEGTHVEYVKQATKTARDNYVTVLLMENKVVTKQILAENGIRVPFGESFTDPTKALEAYTDFHDKAIVIKPKSNNYGLGISIFKTSFSEKDYHEALDIAFSYDQAVIIEEFIPGEEYRFLVIDNKIEAVMRRVPANVVGDGIHTIAELVTEKNSDPLRGTNHLKPLEQIQNGPEEALMLSIQGLTFESVPAPNQIVYLRENSNISTGGDSIDVTAKMDDYYKQLAIQCTQVVGAKFCGVDIILPPDPTTYEQAAIIELNFNPAVHMHCFPYQGERKKIGDRIIDYLFK
ncbi:bifunctional glutamate--cysteine ligase GshA/glutathione synthetase GshB [Listeria ilorinensis]|uniref:bifunctional glutamate--cysteine ligase GshA/glutathione synthetase GshB n=1 Tax=Listeria ilorinensis TaxID=2867439 RepID=UPI001EF659BE|nr:bifunctional glutamate--cysteine ligase GshA/glutathione synthetase GshB [Listeria ilorinensis]